MLAIIFLWLPLCIAVGIFASRYNRSGLGWFLLSVVLSPLLGWIFVLALGPAGERLVVSPAAPSHGGDISVNIPAIVGIGIVAAIIGLVLAVNSGPSRQTTTTSSTSITASSTDGYADGSRAVRQLAAQCGDNKSEYCNRIRAQDAWYQNDAVRRRTEQQPKQAVVVEITNPTKPKSVSRTPKSASDAAKPTKAKNSAKPKSCTAYVNGDRIGTYQDADTCARHAKIKGVVVVYH